MDRNSTNFPRKVYVSLKNYLKANPETPHLQLHQALVKQFFANSEQRGLLIFHGTGTGKTMVAVAVADALKNQYEVLVLSSKSLRSNFQKEVVKYNKMKGEGFQGDQKEADGADGSQLGSRRLVNERGYTYMSSNASNLVEQLQRLDKSDELRLLEKEYEVDSKINLDGKLVIIDEAQNFFNGVVSGSVGANALYNAIMASRTVRLLFLSATPIINDPFEVVPMFNMLAGESLFPDDYDEFHTLFVGLEKAKNPGQPSQPGQQSQPSQPNQVAPPGQAGQPGQPRLTMINRERFKNRIFGLVSYMGDWWKNDSRAGTVKRPDFPDEMPIVVERIPMSAEQFGAYSIARDRESQVKKKRTVTKESMHKPKSDPSSTYRVLSRQISNFFLPEFAKEKKVDAKGVIKHVEQLTDSELTNPRLAEIFSPKMARMLERIGQHPGLSLVYSSFVEGEGLRIFSEVLKRNNWTEFTVDMAVNLSKGIPIEPKVGRRYVFLTGSVGAEERQQIINIFNSKKNQYGGIIDSILISGAGAEGIDLRNVMSIHIMEPFWNYGRIEQVKARAVRYKSHEDYPPEQRIVHVYVYLSDYPVGYVPKAKKARSGEAAPQPEQTTDVHLFFKSLKNKVLIDKFYAAMVEASFDCAIHRERAPPEVQQKIKCLTCLPTNKKLFYPNFKEELLHENPCEDPAGASLDVKKLTHDGKDYYVSVTASPPNIYGKAQPPIVKVFQFDAELEAYTEAPDASDIMDEVVEMPEYKEAKIIGGWSRFHK